MTDDLIERIARAMFERELDHGPWQQRSEIQEAIYMADARVAFEIMQEFAFAHGPLLAEVKRSGKNPEAGNAMASGNPRDVGKNPAT